MVYIIQIQKWTEEEGGKESKLDITTSKQTILLNLEVVAYSRL